MTRQIQRAYVPISGFGNTPTRQAGIPAGKVVHAQITVAGSLELWIEWERPAPRAASTQGRTVTVFRDGVDIPDGAVHLWSVDVPVSGNFPPGFTPPANMHHVYETKD